MNKKGQALVEFIIILPLVLMIFLAVFDYVNIMSSKISLENTLDDVILSNENPDNLIITEKDNKTVYNLKEDINISSPILSAIIGNKYTVNIERVVK